MKKVGLYYLIPLFCVLFLQTLSASPFVKECKSRESPIIGNKERRLFQAPEIISLSVVEKSGNVFINWIPVKDTLNSFECYEIFSSTIFSGPYSLVDSNAIIYFFSHTVKSSNAQNQRLFFYLRARYNLNGIHYSANSDTLGTLLLNAVDQGNGTVLLSWNDVYDPHLNPSEGYYHIWRGVNYPPLEIDLIDSTSSNTYVDTINLCEANMGYWVNYTTGYGSNQRGVYIKDVTAPAAPVIDSVSVDAASKYSVIGWEVSGSFDTEGYIVYEQINNVWLPIDTIYGADKTFYENKLSSWSNPNIASLSYCVAAFDSCLNTSPLSEYHQSIYLTSQYNVCANMLRLHWNQYIHMNQKVKEYRIYGSENKAAYTLWGVVSPDSLSFTYTNINPNSFYTYYVQAVSNNSVFTSSSNKDTLSDYSLPQPQFVYLTHASVKNNSYVEIKAIVDTSAYVSKCNIFRADNISGPFVKIGNTMPALSSNSFVYNDLTANVNEKSYYYKLSLTDSCGYESVTSNIARTIWLNVIAKSNLTNELNWNEYAEWLGTVDGYDVYRKIDEEWDSNPIVTLPAGSVSYIDDVSNFNLLGGKFTYYVKAFEGNLNPYLIADTARSNEVVAIQIPRFYIPNAFCPKGINKIFIPINVYMDSENYLFTIYNRWGIMVFQTNNKNEGWDGSYQNNPAPIGAYVYTIQYKNKQGEIIEKNGTVTLIR